MLELRSRMWTSLNEEETAAAIERDPVVVLPLAATEQHGPHLPVTTDIDIGLGLLDAAYRNLLDDGEAWVLPPVPLGASDEHLSFTGTKRVSREELARLICETGERLAEAGVRRLVLGNSHGGNRHAMEVSGIRLRREHEMLVVKASWFRFARPDVGLPDAE
jgi:creatinine amidohydrolase